MHNGIFFHKIIWLSLQNLWGKEKHLRFDSYSNKNCEVLGFTVVHRVLSVATVTVLKTLKFHVRSLFQDAENKRRALIV